MKRLFLLFLLLAFSISGLDVNKPTQTNSECIAITKDYSLSELLGNVSKIYVSSIREAFATIAPEEDVNHIRFQSLLGGLSKSKLFRVDIKGKKYVLRLLDEKKQIERRKSELNAHRLGSELNIAPKLVYADQIPLVMVMEFVEGRIFSRKDLDDPEVIRKVMQTIKKFHEYSTDVNLLRRTKVEAIQDIVDRYKKRGVVFPSCFDSLYRKIQEECSHLKTERLPTHGDLNPGNILITKDGKVYLIDWAEASRDNPFLDIGWLSCFSAANKDQIKNLLREYLGREPRKAEIKEVFFFKNVTTFLVATLWIGRQEERDQKKLDAILECPLKKGSEYIKEGITPVEISQKEGIELTVYALGWLKEFIENDSMQTSL